MSTTDPVQSKGIIPVEVFPCDTEMLSAIGRLRVRAWKARQPDFPDMPEWLDAFDGIAQHWVIMTAGAPVAAARMTIHTDLSSVPNAEIFAGVFPDGLPGPIASINRLVVDPQYAGQGLSRALDEVRISAARRTGCANVLGETFARTSRVPALEALGFQIVGVSLPYASGPLARVKNGGGGKRPGAPTVLKMAISFPLVSSSGCN